VLLIASIAAFVALRARRGPSGATEPYGGRLAAIAVPDFPSGDPGRWVNGTPESLGALRGTVVLIESWHPD
jgi:hypothetical protein